MKNLSLLTVLCMLFLLAVSANSEKIKSYQENGKIVIDGEIGDWTDYPLSHLEDQKLSLGVRYDSLNLYLLIATRDYRIMNMMYRSGVNVWVNLKGKEKKNFGIKYFSTAQPPDMPEMDDMEMPDRPERDNGDMPDRPDREEMKKRQEAERGKIIVTEDDNKITVNNIDSDQFRAASSLYKGTYLVECKIPFEQGNLIYDPDKKKPRKEIKVGIEIGMNRQIMKRPKRDESFDGGGMRGGIGGGMGGGMGGPPGGGMRGGGPGQITNIDTWFKLEFDREK